MSKTITAEIQRNQFPQIQIEEGTYVVWKNLDPYPHSAETLSESEYYFNAGALFPNGHSSPVYFSKTGTFRYVCRFHHEMAGEVVVVKKGSTLPHHPHDPHGGHGHHLKHLHGFVTGGESSQQMFLTHTPVLADNRHHYQVILQASLPDQKSGSIYDSLRKSTYGDGKIQIFHDHLSLPDIGSGKITDLPKSSFEYYPDGETGEEIPGLKENIHVRIDKVINFHTFQTDSVYPEYLTYIMYGNEKEVFIDHLINRAPSFHSVSKLVNPPQFYVKNHVGKAVTIAIPEKRMMDVSPKELPRVAFVDNSFHLFWLPPTGVYPRTVAQDPLIRRNGSPAVYEMISANGDRDIIEIKRFLHFDVRLLNYGVLIVA